MNVSSVKNEYKNLLVTFLFFSLLSLTLIFSIDDFAWGTGLGIERFSSNFEDYNGRYIGNYVVLLITRYPVIRMLIYGVVNTGIVFFMYRILNRKVPYYIILSLTLLMPLDLYRQTYGWLSGFANYNVPVFFLLWLVYLFMKKEKNILVIAASFAISVNIQLYLENITVVNCVVTGILVVWALLSKKNRIWSISVFLGMVLGALVMFSNTAYSSNTTNRGLSNIDLSFMWSNYFTQWSELFFKSNVLLIILLCVGLLLITKKNRLVTFFSVSTMIYFVMRYILNIHWKQLPTKWLYLEGLFIIVILLFSLFVVLKSEKLTEKIKINFIIFFLLGGLYAGPFLVLQIDDQAFIASRNVYASYILFLISFLQLYVPTLEQVKIKNREIIKIVGISLMLIFLVISGTNKVFDIKRMDYTINQIDAGAKEVKIQRLPFEQLSFPWALSEDSRFINPFKEYYGIPKEVKIYPKPIKNKYN
nr:hypothetical protein [Vagococcus fluvialis]